MDELIFRSTRAVTQIDHIIEALWRIVYEIFKGNGYGTMLINTIMENNYLLISLSLVLCGFVIGIIRRMIQM